MKILLTHGHTVDGADKGAISHNGVSEGLLNYELANCLKNVLTSIFEVEVDVKQEEVNKALEWNVKNRKGYDVAISIHHNSFNKSATGTEVLYKEKDVLAKKISKEIAKTLSLNDRGAKKRDDLYILNIGFDVLVEVCFIDNKKDFSSNYSVEEIAFSMAKVLGQHCNLKEKGDGEMVTTTDILIDGKKYNVSRILKDGKNYVELRAFEQAGYKVGYIDSEKLATFDGKQ